MLDPTQAELSQFSTLDDILNSAGITGSPRTGLKAALGQPQLIPDILLILRTNWDAAVAFRIPCAGTAANLEQDPSDEALSPLQQGQMEAFDGPAACSAACRQTHRDSSRLLWVTLWTALSPSKFLRR